MKTQLTLAIIIAGLLTGCDDGTHGMTMPPGYHLVCAGGQLFTYQTESGMLYNWADDVSNDKRDAYRRAWRDYEIRKDIKMHYALPPKIEAHWEVCE